MSRPATLLDRTSFTMHVAGATIVALDDLAALLMESRPGSSVTRADAARQAITIGIAALKKELEADASRKKGLK